MKEKKFLLEKTRLKETVKEICKRDPRLLSKMEEAYEKLLSEGKRVNPMLRRHLKNSIFPAIAVYQTLIAHGEGRASAYESVRKAVLSDSERSKKMFEKMGSLPFGFSLMRVLCPLSIKMNFGKSGWDFKWKRNDMKALEWDCHRCFYMDVFAEHGVAELTSIFCESDDFVYGSIPSMRWARTKTIGKGNEVCDFKFYKEKKRKRSRRWKG